MEFKAVIVKGKLQYPDLSRFEGKEVVVNIEVYKYNRSIEQNKLYWKKIEIIANESGYSKDELHGYFKYSFIAREFLRNIGQDTAKLTIDSYIRLNSESDIMQTLNHYVSTTVLTTKEFTEYIDKIEKWSLDNYNIDLTKVIE